MSVFTEKDIQQEALDYLSQTGHPGEERPDGGIKFNTGLDTWIIFISNVSSSNKNMNVILLHKDIMLARKNRQHAIYKGILDSHIQKKFIETDNIKGCINYALKHKRKWTTKAFR